MAKAREFLEAAQSNHDLGLYNAATSNAVTASINAKDAICLKRTGRTEKTENHHAATAELSAAGREGRALESTFGRLLRLKPRSQYLSTLVSASDAAKSIEWATRMVESAREIVTS